MSNFEPNIIQARICYKFKNPKLLESAFTHASYVNEHKATGNERIEFLGDCVLNFLVGEKLFMQDPSAQEGDLSARRSAIVSRKPLARIIDKFGLIDFLKVGVGVKKNEFSAKTRSDLFEALLGAIYLDGGLDAAKAILDNIFYPYVLPENDHKSKLQRYVVSKGSNVEYTTEEYNGEFIAWAVIGTERYKGGGRTKHEAEISAAEAAYNAMTNGKD